ncbi:MAG: hypothetical protein V3W44_09490 [Dehalococcoidales bacterium]
MPNTKRPPYQGTPAIRTPPFDGSAQWFVAVSGKIAKAMCKDPVNRDLHAVARAFGALATSARGFIQRSELEEQVSELTTLVSDMAKAGNYGTGFTSSTDIRAAGADRPEAPSH